MFSASIHGNLLRVLSQALAITGLFMGQGALSARPLFAVLACLSLITFSGTSLAEHAKLIDVEVLTQQLSHEHGTQSQVNSIILAAEDSWPPFADQFGKGISHQLVKSAFAEVGIRVETLVVPYSRGLRMAERGNVDGVFNVTREVSTQDKFIFGQQPLFQASASFYQHKSHPISAKSKYDLAPKAVIGVIKGYEYGDEFPQLVKQKDWVLFIANNQMQLINMLLVNRIDLAVMFDAVAKEQLTQMGVNEEIQPIFNNHQSDIFVAFSKQQPNSSLLAKKLDEGLIKLKSQGQYAKLLLPLKN
ncbi:ABC transporter substrate-binding protein [Shewanella denitrificans]